MLTAYTMRTAQLLDPHCDMLLVGDSLGQVIYGLPSTIPVTMEMMCAHGAAVVRGSWHALVGVDMPFGSYEGIAEQAFASASRIMKETGCAAVKLEGGEAMAPTIDFLTHRGIPVIGHVGLTPQAVNVLGGYGARGRDEARGRQDHRRRQGGRRCRRLLHRARRRDGGNRRPKCAQHVAPPVIGIGASAQCDGQVLVTEDMLGLFERTPRFVKRYDDLASRIGEAAAQLCRGGARAELPDARPDLPAKGLNELPFARQTLDEAPPASVHPAVRKGSDRHEHSRSRGLRYVFGAAPRYQ